MVSRPAPRPLPRRPAPRRPSPAVEQQQQSFNSFPQQQRQQPVTLEDQLRVFAPAPVQAKPQPRPQSQPSPQQPQQGRFSNFRANPQPKPQAQPRPQPTPQRTQPSRFSNFGANLQRARGRGAVPVTAAPVTAAPAPTPRPQQSGVAPLRPTPAQDDLFNDYDSGEHKLSRFQLFQLRKKQESLGATVVAQQEVETNQVLVDEPLGQQKVVAVRRKKVRG